jgi:hypothetical protein
MQKKNQTTKKKKKIKPRLNNSIEKINTIDSNCYPDLRYDLKHFIYGMIFGALLMLIFLRILQLT